MSLSVTAYAGAQASASATSGHTGAMDRGYGAVDHTYGGRVVSYDETGHRLVVSGKEGDKTFDVSRATMKGTVRPDETVAVRYTEKDGRMVASSVTAAGAGVSRNEVQSNARASERTAFNGPKYGYGDQDMGRGYDILDRYDFRTNS